MASLLQQAIQLAKRGGTTYIPAPGTVAYVLNHGQGESDNIYEVERTQGIVTALQKRGLKVYCLGSQEGPRSLEDAVAQLEETLRSCRPERILAISDAELGLSAWVVAQRLNLPFYVEVRDFPEYMRDVFEPGYATTPHFRNEVERDTFVARQAARVFTLNAAMKGELARRGVDPNRIELVPIGFKRLPAIRPEDPALRARFRLGPGDKVIGCDGRFSAIEDLDTLVDACMSLVAQGENVKLILVGDDPEVSQALDRARMLVDRTWLIHVQELPDECIAEFYALLDVLVIPHKSLPLCELVPSIEVAEALAYGKRLVVSNVAALAEYAVKYEGITVVEAASTEGMAQGLRLALEAPEPSPPMDLLLESGIRKLAEFLTSSDLESGLSTRHMELAAGWSRCEEIFCAEETYRGKSTQEVIDCIRGQDLQAHERASELTRLARIALPRSHEVAANLGLAAVRLDPKPFRLKWLAFLLFDAGQVTIANDILGSLSPEIIRRTEERDKANYIHGCARLLLNPPALKEMSTATPYSPSERKVLYVASSARPHHFSGYTSRTHGVVKGLLNLGWDVLCVTRPGYPDDRVDRSMEAGTSQCCFELDGVRYQTLQGPHRRGGALDEYLYKCADIIVDKAIEERAAIIHAASNYEASFPALIAARRLGLRFVYEVRGLWEYTAASKMPGWEKTERFCLDECLESFVVKHADRVITLTAALADELVKRGGDREKILVAPNAIDPDEFKPRERKAALGKILGLSQDNFVIGYAGSVVSYEGLDGLVSAFSDLVKRQPSARILIVGGGSALGGLRELSVQLGVRDKVIFTGQVKPEEVPDYLSLMSIIVLPRKKLKVCELVSPLKPFEAMAMKIPLLVSSVNALREIAIAGEAAFLFQSEDNEDLVRILEKMIRSRDSMYEVAERAYKYVHEKHTWEKVALHITLSYDRELGR